MNVADQVAIKSVKRWFEEAVLGLNLCPFAARPYLEKKIVFQLSRATNDEQCLVDLYLNIERLNQNSDIETLLLICPYHLGQFTDFNQFLSLADQLLLEEGWEGIYQIASFHPDYRFDQTDANDRSNWTNRSPFPVLHLLREESIRRALEGYPGIEDIPAQNIKTLNALSDGEMNTIFAGGCAKVLQKVD